MVSKGKMAHKWKKGENQQNLRTINRHLLYYVLTLEYSAYVKKSWMHPVLNNNEVNEADYKVWRFLKDDFTAVVKRSDKWA